MVVKIQKSHGSMYGTLAYNNRKVSEGNASVLGVYSSGNDMESAIDDFDLRERRNIRTERVSFQMSINPDPDDPSEALTDDEARSYALRLMDGLGFAGQPIIVYKHQDIERTHYHVVSIRVRENGRKISDSNDRPKLQKLMKRLQKEFHYEIGNPEKKKEQKKSTDEKVERFSKSRGDIRNSIARIFKEALSYNFQTTGQFTAVMESYGLKLTWPAADESVCVVQGLDIHDRPVTAPMTETELGIKMMQAINARMSECRKKNRDLAERKTTAQTVRDILSQSTSLDEVKARLHAAGYFLHLTRTKTGEIFGCTIIDKNKKVAYKASELDRTMSAKVFKDMDSTQSVRPAKVTKKTVVKESNAKQKPRQESKEHAEHRNETSMAAHAGNIPENRNTATDTATEALARAADDLIHSGSGQTPRDKVAQNNESEKHKKPRKPRYV